MRVLKAAVDGPVLLPDSGFLLADPGFEGHDITERPDGTSGSYFFLWEMIRDNNGVAAGIHGSFADQIAFQGWRAVGEQAEVDRWNRWDQEANFTSKILPQLLEEMIGIGNGMGLLHRKTGRILDLRCQPLPVRGFFPLKDEERESIDRWIFRWPSFKAQTDPKFGAGWILPVECTIHFKFNGRVGAVFGRMLGYQVINELEELRDLLRVIGAMANRGTHGLIHAKVSLEGLDEIDEDNTTPDDDKDELTPAERHIKNVETIMGKRVHIDKNTRRVSIAHNIVTDESVTLIPIDSKQDLAGAEKAADVLFRTIDRATRMPRVLQGEGEGSNRATAEVQRRLQAALWERLWDDATEEIMDKVFKLLDIDRSRMTLERVNKLVLDDMEFQVLHQKAIREDFQAGITDVDEARREADKYYEEDLEPLGPEEPAEEEPEPSSEHPPEEEPERLQ